VNRGLTIALDVLFVVHVFLHLIFYNRPENRLSLIFSYVLIFSRSVRRAQSRWYPRPGQGFREHFVPLWFTATH
jgi:hypothetical protein